MAEHAVASARDGHTRTCSGLRHKHTHQSKARGGLAELGVSGFVRNRKADGGDQLTGIQCGGIHAVEEVIGSNGALVGVHCGAQGQHGAGVAGCRIVVGDRAAQCAHGADLLVANAVGQGGQRGDVLAHLSIVGHVLVARHGADHQVVAFFADTGQGADGAQVDHGFRLLQALLHGSDHGLATGQGVTARSQQGLRSSKVGGTFVVECVHE